MVYETCFANSLLVESQTTLVLKLKKLKKQNNFDRYDLSLIGSNLVLVYYCQVYPNIKTLLCNSLSILKSTNRKYPGTIRKFGGTAYGCRSQQLF